MATSFSEALIQIATLIASLVVVIIIVLLVRSLIGKTLHSTGETTIKAGPILLTSKNFKGGAYIIGILILTLSVSTIYTILTNRTLTPPNGEQTTNTSSPACLTLIRGHLTSRGVAEVSPYADGRPILATMPPTDTGIDLASPLIDLGFKEQIFGIRSPNGRIDYLVEFFGDLTGLKAENTPIPIAYYSATRIPMSCYPEEATIKQ